MKINGNEIKVGYVIEHKNRLWVATKTQHTQPGKGGAYLQVELKDIKDGTKLNERFRSSESVEKAYLEEVEKQFLYADGADFAFMDNKTFEQLTLPGALMGDAADFLQEGMIVKVSYYNQDPISVALPDHVVMEIVEADPVIKGQTASASYKPARLENGRRIMVPPHIESGTRVVVTTADCGYVERAKD